MEKKKSIGAEMVARRYEKMTPEERSAAAKNAAVKRWAKKREEAAGADKPAKKSAGKPAGKKKGKKKGKKDE